MTSKIEQGAKNREAVKQAVGRSDVLSADEIAAKTKLKKATAARHLRALVEDGFLVTGISAEDARVTTYVRA